MTKDQIFFPLIMTAHRFSEQLKKLADRHPPETLSTLEKYGYTEDDLMNLCKELAILEKVVLKEDNEQIN